MKRIAKFHKVSWEQFRKDWVDTFGEQPEEKIREIYEGIKLPKRATRGSAGYDFFAPVSFTTVSYTHLDVYKRQSYSSDNPVSVLPKRSDASERRIQWNRKSFCVGTSGDLVQCDHPGNCHRTVFK